MVMTVMIYGQQQCIYRVHPLDTDACLNDNAVFAARVDTLFFVDSFYYEWLYKPNSASVWTLIQNGDPFMITTTGLSSTLEVKIDGSGTLDGYLFISRISGQYSSDVASLKINSLPGISFSSQNFCFKNITHFINTSEDLPDIVSWSWEISDGSKYFAKDINHMFSSPGDYAIQLIGVDENGCMGTSSSNVSISALPEPEILFTKDVFCGYESNVSFYAADTFLTYLWEIEGLNQIIKSDSNDIIFNCDDNFPTGQYKVSLTVSSQEGCYEKTDKNFLVLSSTAPVDGFVIQKEINSNLLVLLIEDQELSDFRWMKIDIVAKDTMDVITKNPYHLFDEPINTQDFKYGVEVKPEFSDCSAIFYLKP
jgi:PKD repeat protein